MDNPTGPERRRALHVTAILAYLRREGGQTEEEIAEKLEFGSPEAMYRQLQNWGLPAWLVGGDSPKEDPGTKPKIARRARKGGGEVVELPPAADAGPLFRKVLERLLGQVDRLPQRVEHLQDGRFIVERDTSGDFGEVFGTLRREDYAEEEWRKFMEQRGEDPAANFVGVPMTDYRAPGGASPAPPEPLATLVAVYAVAGGEPGPLLDVLYPDVRGADRREIEEQLAGIEERMKKEARRYATGARGGTVKTGPPPAGLTADEHSVAIYIKERRTEGATDDQIVKELRRHGPYHLPLRITDEEVQRLGNLELD